MRPKLNPNYPSTGVVILVLGSSLALLVIGAFGAFVVREELALGRVYSFGALYGNGPTISRLTSPGPYWVHMAIYSAGCLTAIGLGAIVPIGTLRALIKKRKRQKNEPREPTQAP